MASPKSGMYQCTCRKCGKFAGSHHYASEYCQSCLDEAVEKLAARSPDQARREIIEAMRYWD